MSFEREILENHKRYLERQSLYRFFGLDGEKERNFLIDNAGPVRGKILEVGTGKGYFTLRLAQAGYRFTSIDISAEEQKIAELNLKYYRFEHLVDLRIENAEHLSFPDKSFDIIFSVNTVHHFKNSFKVMEELIRVLKKGGKIILSDFSSEGLRIVDRVHMSEGRKHETAQFNLWDVEMYMKLMGFKTEKYETEFQEIVKCFKKGR